MNLMFVPIHEYNISFIQKHLNFLEYLLLLVNEIDNNSVQHDQDARDNRF